MGKGTKFSRFGKSAKAVKNTSQRLMKNHTTDLGKDYPADEYTITSVRRTTSKDNKALEKSSGVKIFDVKLKKKRKKRRKK